MKRYSTLKPSGNDWLGDIPDGWEVKRLKYISYTRVSNVDKKSEDEIQVKLCNYVDVYKNEFITEKIDFMIATATRRQVDAFELKKGDVILTKDSETPDDIGIPAYVDLEDTKNIVCGYHLAISTPINSVLLGKYLFRLIQSNIFRSYFEVSSNGITRYGLDTYSIFNADILLPSFSEQRIIADFLDRETGKINHLISKKQKLIDLLKEERTAIINQAVTKGINPYVEMKDSGIEWLGKIPENWHLVPMKKYLNSVVDYRGKTPTKKENGEVFLVTARNIKDGIINYTLSQEYISKDEYTQVMQRGKPIIGDVLFTTEAPLGEVANVDREDIALAQRIIKFRANPKYLDNYYLKEWLSSQSFQNDLQSYATGSTALGIKASKLNFLKLLLPPLSEQKKILIHINKEREKIDASIVKIEKEIDLLKEYRTALISEVVTGKIDVRQEVAVWI